MSTRQRRSRQARQGDIQDPSISSTVQHRYFPLLDPVYISSSQIIGVSHHIPSNTYWSFVSYLFTWSYPLLFLKTVVFNKLWKLLDAEIVQTYTSKGLSTSKALAIVALLFLTSLWCLGLVYRQFPVLEEWVLTFYYLSGKIHYASE